MFNDTYYEGVKWIFGNVFILMPSILHVHIKGPCNDIRSRLCCILTHLLQACQMMINTFVMSGGSHCFSVAKNAKFSLFANQLCLFIVLKCAPLMYVYSGAKITVKGA